MYKSTIQTATKAEIREYLRKYKGPVIMRSIGKDTFLYQDMNTWDLIAEESPRKGYIVTYF